MIPTDELVLRTPISGLLSSFLWAWVVGVSSLIGLSSQDVIDRSALAGPALAVLVWSILSVRRVTARVVVQPGGLEVRNILKTHTISWSEIDAVGVTTSVSIWNLNLMSVMVGLGVRVKGRERTLRLAGTSTLRNNTLVESLRALQKHGARHGIPVAISTTDLSDPLRSH